MRRRSDTEPTLGVLMSGTLFLFASLAALLFLTYRTWSGSWPLLA